MNDISSPLVSTPKVNIENLDKKLQKSNNIDQVQKAAKQFESLFVNEMMAHIFNGIEVNEYFGGGRGEEIFRSMLVEQYSKSVAESKQTKISDILTRQMIRMQEEQQNVTHDTAKGV